MPKHATQSDYDALAEVHSQECGSIEGALATAQDAAFELGVARGEQIERERIITLLESTGILNVRETITPKA